MMELQSSMEGSPIYEKLFTDSDTTKPSESETRLSNPACNNKQQKQASASNEETMKAGILNPTYSVQLVSSTAKENIYCSKEDVPPYCAEDHVQ